MTTCKICGLEEVGEPEEEIRFDVDDYYCPEVD